MQETGGDKVVFETEPIVTVEVRDSFVVDCAAGSEDIGVWTLLKTYAVIERAVGHAFLVFVTVRFRCYDNDAAAPD